MYFQQDDHDNVARKEIQYFLDYLRERYGLNTNSLDREFSEVLANKSGIFRDDDEDLVRLLHNAQRSISLSEYDLLTLNTAIEKFKQCVV